MAVESGTAQSSGEDPGGQAAHRKRVGGGGGLRAVPLRCLLISADLHLWQHLFFSQMLCVSDGNEIEEVGSGASS